MDPSSPLDRRDKPREAAALSVVRNIEEVVGRPAKPIKFGAPPAEKVGAVIDCGFLNIQADARWALRKQDRPCRRITGRNAIDAEMSLHHDPGRGAKVRARNFPGCC